MINQSNELPNNPTTPFDNPPELEKTLENSFTNPNNKPNTKSNEPFDEFKSEELIQCDFCNRRFLPDRLPIHQRLCTSEKPFKPLPSRNQQKPEKKTIALEKGNANADEEDRMIKDSLKYSKLYKKAQQIRNNNIKPWLEMENFPIKTSYIYDLDKQYEEIDLVKCDRCGRKFASNRLKKHKIACEKMAKAEIKHKERVEIAKKRMEEKGAIDEENVEENKKIGKEVKVYKEMKVNKGKKLGEEKKLDKEEKQDEDKNQDKEQKQSEDKNGDKKKKLDKEEKQGEDKKLDDGKELNEENKLDKEEKQVEKDKNLEKDTKPDENKNPDKDTKPDENTKQDEDKKPDMESKNAEKDTKNPAESNKSHENKKSNWKAAHEDFLKTLKSIKKTLKPQEEQPPDSSYSLPPSIEPFNNKFIQCPHCTRSYYTTTAERHIKKCKEIKQEQESLNYWNIHNTQYMKKTNSKNHLPHYTKQSSIGAIHTTTMSKNNEYPSGTNTRFKFRKSTFPKVIIFPPLNPLASMTNQPEISKSLTQLKSAKSLCDSMNQPGSKNLMSTSTTQSTISYSHHDQHLYDNNQANNPSSRLKGLIPQHDLVNITSNSNSKANSGGNGGNEDSTQNKMTIIKNKASFNLYRGGRSASAYDY